MNTAISSTFAFMKNASRLVLFLSISMLSSAFANLGNPGKLRKGFEALEVYNYFKAKDLFYQSLKRDSVPAAYGLSLIYGRDDNPFFQLDSAFKFITIANRIYPRLDSDDKRDYLEIGVDSIAISHQLHKIDSLFYGLALNKNSVDGWHDFIAAHHSEPFHENAVSSRNQLAFDLAQSENLSEAYAEFITKYPDAIQAPEAQKIYENLFYKEQTVGDRIKDYQKFMLSNPESPYVSDAENRVYEIATKSGKVSSYLQFIKDFPNNNNTDSAWRNVYKLEIGELSATSIAAFSLKYPEYPFMDELKQEFEYATTFYYPIMVDSLWGFIDEKGTVRIKPAFDWVEPFSENIAMVGKGEKIAFVNKAGERITDFNFENAYAFKNGFAVVEKSEHFGVINRLGEEVIPFIYQDVGEFNDDLFYVQNDDDKYGFLDNHGKIIVPFVLSNASDFNDGLAVVESEGAQGVIDKQGRMVVNFIYDWIEPFSDKNKPSRVRIGSHFGLIDHHGIVVADTVYSQIGDFSDGLALAADESNFGYINLRGDTTIAFKYTYKPAALKSSVFVNNHARIFQKDKMGIIDTAGTKIFPAIFEDTGNFTGKLIPVKKNGKWGYANQAVDLVIGYKYDSAENFKDSLAIVSVKGKYGLIDTLGHPKVDFKYKSIVVFDSLALVSDTAYGLINLNGIEKVPLVYNEAKQINNQVIQFTKSTGDGPDYYDISKQKFIWRQNY